MVQSTTKEPPEHWLGEALAAGSAVQRAKYATRGLASQSVDDDVRALLLRQLYLSHLEGRRFEDARAVALHIIESNELGDIAERDAAIACIALGDENAALTHLRLAGRVAPAGRRATHLSCLGGLHYVRGEYESAIHVLERGLRWATSGLVPYRAQLALVKHAAGREVLLEPHLEAIEAASKPGIFGLYLCAELAARLGYLKRSRVFSDRFIAAYAEGSPVQQTGLWAENQRMCAALDGQ